MTQSVSIEVTNAIGEYLSSKKSIASIAEKYGYSYGWLLKHLKINNIKRRGHSEWKLNVGNEISACKDYQSGLLVKDIASKYSVSRRTITEWLKKNNLKPLKLNERLGITPEMKEKAIKLYKDDLLNCVEISKLIGVSNRSIYDWTRNIKRSRSEISCILASKGKKKSYGKKGYVNTRLGNIRYDSTYERDRIIQISDDSHVLSLSRYKGFIKYGSKNYNPDFQIEYSCGCKVIEEVKPKFMIDSALNQSKFNAATDFCSQRNLLFRVISEKEIYGK